MWCGWQEVKKKKKKWYREVWESGNVSCAWHWCQQFCSASVTHAGVHSILHIVTHSSLLGRTGADDNPILLERICQVTTRHAALRGGWPRSPRSAFLRLGPAEVVRAFKLSLPHSHLRQNIHGILYARRCQHQRSFFFSPSQNYLLPVNILMV